MDPLTIKGVTKFEFVPGATDESTFTAGLAASGIVIIAQEFTLNPQVQMDGDIFVPDATTGLLVLDEVNANKAKIEIGLKSNRAGGDQIRVFTFGKKEDDIDDYNVWTPMDKDSINLRGIGRISVLDSRLGASKPAFKCDYFGVHVRPDGSFTAGENVGDVGFMLTLQTPYAKMYRYNSAATAA